MYASPQRRTLELCKANKDETHGRVLRQIGLGTHPKGERLVASIADRDPVLAPKYNHAKAEHKEQQRKRGSRQRCYRERHFVRDLSVTRRYHGPYWYRSLEIGKEGEKSCGHVTT